MAVDLSVAQARRLALTSLGFGQRRPARAGAAHVRATVRCLSAIQIDSVNVLARAHYLPVFSRYGPYPTSVLDDLVHRRRELFEYCQRPGQDGVDRLGPRRLLPAHRAVSVPARTNAVFGFEYQIEIYVPAPKRIYGYYVLPFLMGEGFAGRVDLKADRKASNLLVQAAYVEAGADPSTVAEALAGELHQMAEWLGLQGITVAGKGDLARTLVRALR